jgi:hypothetical protein
VLYTSWELVCAPAYKAAYQREPWRSSASELRIRTELQTYHTSPGYGFRGSSVGSADIVSTSSREVIRSNNFASGRGVARTRVRGQAFVGSNVRERGTVRTDWTGRSEATRAVRWEPAPALTYGAMSRSEARQRWDAAAIRAAQSTSKLAADSRPP